ncbi:MAG: ATP-binding protein [Thermomicrobiales bacterium]
MPRLILLNGAPGSGKSTLARRLAADPSATAPLALVLDIDVLRGMLGRWFDTPGEAGMLARQHALAMIHLQLRQGRDVIVPQFLGRIDFVLHLADAAAACGVPFVEIALVSSPDDAASRFRHRSQHPEDQTHRDAAALEADTSDRIPAMYAAMMAVAAARPETHFVESVDGDEAGTHARVVAAIRDAEAAHARPARQ